MSGESVCVHRYGDWQPTGAGVNGRGLTYIVMTAACKKCGHTKRKLSA